MPLLLPELNAKSALDVVEENFQNLGLKAYAIRMIYIGEHTLTKDEIITHFKKSVQGVNSGYCEINLYGILLVYDSYFVHILEGSEDTVHRQLRFLFKREEDWIQMMAKQDEDAILEGEEPLTALLEKDAQQKPDRKMFKKMKILMIYHSITTLTFDNWRALTARPPSLIGKLNIHGPLSEHIEQLSIGLDKITKLCSLAKSDDSLIFEGLSAADPKMEALPEVALLDFLLQSQYILDLRQVRHMHRRVDDYIFYHESVWPLPTHFTPRQLFKLKVDDSFVPPLPVMPWEMVKPVETEEEKEERQSGSSDSD